jgi:hypothetical protein
MKLKLTLLAAIAALAGCAHEPFAYIDGNRYFHAGWLGNCDLHARWIGYCNIHTRRIAHVNFHSDSGCITHPHVYIYACRFTYTSARWFTYRTSAGGQTSNCWVVRCE